MSDTALGTPTLTPPESAWTERFKNLGSILTAIGHHLLRSRSQPRDAALEVIDKSGHYVHMDRPRELVQTVTTFLGGEV